MCTVNEYQVAWYKDMTKQRDDLVELWNNAHKIWVTSEQQSNFYKPMFTTLSFQQIRKSQL